ncbi:MAG: anti-sigma factor family protein [Leptolyngbyaceae cyanobacterium]
MSERYQPPRAKFGASHQALCRFDYAATNHYRDLDATKRDRFELLSAYLDGEVSPDERRLVATWLDKDPEAQCLYRRLLQLRQGFQGLNSNSQLDYPPCDAADQVIRRLNRRFRMTCMAGMTAAAVAVIGVFSGALNPIERLGGGTISASSASEDSLEIALDQPPIAIPKPVMTKQALPMEPGLSGVDQPGELGQTAL